MCYHSVKSVYPVDPTELFILNFVYTAYEHVKNLQVIPSTIVVILFLIEDISGPSVCINDGSFIVY